MADKNFSTTPIAQLTLAQLSPQDLIAPNFRFHEITVSEIAVRRGIDNRIDSDEKLRAAVHLARQVLQPLRDTFGPFAPNSVFRSQALERVLKGKAVNWLSTSQHTLGRACDVEIVGMPTLALAQWATKNLEHFDQIICECHDPAQGPNSGWVHVSLVPPGQGKNRRQALSYVVDPATGELTYVAGLQASVG